MVVGVNLNAALRAGEGRQHFVHIHVRGRSRARLVGIDGEMIVMGSLNDLLGCRHDGIGDCSIDDAKLFVHQRCRALDVGERDNLSGFQASARNREILDRSLSLCAV